MDGMAATEGRYTPVLHEISRAPGATDEDAMNAFLTDISRRVRAGEISILRISAEDVNGDTLVYDTRRP